MTRAFAFHMPAVVALSLLALSLLAPSAFAQRPAADAGARPAHVADLDMTNPAWGRRPDHASPSSPSAGRERFGRLALAQA